MTVHRRVRLFSWLSVVTVFAMILAGCGPAVAPAPAEPAAAPAAEEAPAAEMSGPEAPMLAEMVAAGTLPPLEERLPADVLVLEPEDSIGKYGGTLRGPHAWDVFFEQGLLQRLHNDRDTFMPQVAKGWDWADDFTSITFHLRQGMKWSDGQPYGADDILFWWNDIVQSKYNVQPFRVSGMNTATDTVVKVDESTVRFEFAEPRPSFLLDSRGAWSYGFYGLPAHYFKQFHPDYNDTAADKAQEEFDKLRDVLHQSQWVVKDADAPTVNAWKAIEYKEGQYVLFERNAYYFGVDPDGNQLPYIDYIEGLDKYDQDAELLKAKTLAGETDILFRVVRPSDFPVFKEKEEELGLQITFFDDVFNGRQTFMINQNYTGEAAIVELLETADFRRALSLALDRELMNEVIHLGLGRPGHGFSPPGVFDEAIDGSYATRDPDAANALLDGIGLDQRDSDGLRTMADGSQLTIILMLRSGWGIGSDETADIATDNWREIGLRVVAKPVERKLNSELLSANDWQIRLIPSTGGWTGYWRYGMSLRQFAREADDWIQSATEEERRGTEPQGKLKELADLQQLALQSQDKEESQMAYHQYREVLADQLFQIGTVANSPAILVHNGKLRNVPGQVMPAAISQGESEYLRFEQWYYQQ